MGERGKNNYISIVLSGFGSESDSKAGDLVKKFEGKFNATNRTKGKDRKSRVMTKHKNSLIPIFFSVVTESPSFDNLSDESRLII